jgi:hypothetical protein
MKKIVFQQFALVLLILCFIAGTLGIAYNVCNMDKSTIQKQVMENMDCHKEKPVPQKNSCCVDFSCPKCFSLPLNTATNSIIKPQIISSTLLLSSTYHLYLYNPEAPERPPKT